MRPSELNVQPIPGTFPAAGIPQSEFESAALGRAQKAIMRRTRGRVCCRFGVDMFNRDMFKSNNNVGKHFAALKWLPTNCSVGGNAHPDPLT